MADRRNPYFILGIDFGASPQQAQAAFAKLSRRLRRDPGAPYRMEDATWALHQIEHAATDPDANLGVYRVPANPDAYTYPEDGGILAVAPQNLPRRTASSAEEVAALRAEVAGQLATSALGAAVGDWEAAGRVSDEPVASPRTGAGREPAGAGAARRYDPLAVAFGNATLLGVGYLLLRRWGTAVIAIGNTVLLATIVAQFGQPGWLWRVVVALWWITTVVHGWRAAQQAESPPAAVTSSGVPGGGGRPGVQRAIAVGAVLVVLAGVIGLAVEARRIGAAAADAHHRGDCETAVETLDRIGARHRLVDPYVTRRTGGDAAACQVLLAAYAEADHDPLAAAEKLREYLAHETGRWGGAAGLRTDLLLAAAEGRLDAALDGDVGALGGGFLILGELLADDPGHAAAVNAVAREYLSQLPAVDPCHAKANLDWLATRDAGTQPLDQVIGPASELAPPVILACGDQLLDGDPRGARDAYQDLLARYPDHRLVSDARRGLDAAETLIEEEQVSALIRGSRYCDDPSPYRGAAPYRGGGPHPVLTFGSDKFGAAVPEEWRAKDHRDAVLVLCVDGPADGRVLETCYYDGGIDYPGATFPVELRAHRYDVTAYELHTGELAFETTVQIGSGGCPAILEWTCSSYFPNCPPPASISATHSNDQIRSAVRSWVFR